MLTSPPIALKTLTELNRLKIRSLDDLRQIGAVRAFLLLKSAGLTVTRSTLWQLAALVQDIEPQSLNEADKNGLLQAVRQHPPVAIFPSQEKMEYFMGLALKQAELSAQKGEVPVGAVIVRNNEVIAQAHNTCISSCDISHHAEICALREAGQVMNNYRLDDCDIYITLEPCSMCSGALIQSRIQRVIFGAAENKTGAAGSVVDLFANNAINKHTAITGGVLADEARKLLQNFFQAKR